MVWQVLFSPTRSPVSSPCPVTFRDLVGKGNQQWVEQES